jgi:hypothetical protein
LAVWFGLLLASRPPSVHRHQSSVLHYRSALPYMAAIAAGGQVRIKATAGRPLRQCLIALPGGRCALRLLQVARPLRQCLIALPGGRCALRLLQVGRCASA